MLRAAFISLLLTGCMGSSAWAQGWSPQAEQQADWLMRQLTQSQAPSATVAVSINGTIVYAKGFGRIGNSAPTPHTVYPIGSVSKQFTAAAILALAEDGAKVAMDGQPFSIDDNVSKFFTGVDHWSPRQAPAMTIRRLLNMTSNLPSYTSTGVYGLDPTQRVAWRALLHGLKRISPAAGPPRFEYSNTNYFLLSLVAENVTSGGGNGDYHKYLRDRIFSRAAMPATDFLGDPAPSNGLAPPTYRGSPSFSIPAWPKGAGEMRSNVIDISSWNWRLMSGEILAPASVDEMLRPAAPAGAAGSYGMGWFIRSFPSAQEYSHGGNIAGYTAQNLVVKTLASDIVSVVILTNGDSVQGLDQLASALANAAISPSPPLASTPQPFTQGGVSSLCRFTLGPRAGQLQDYAPAPPVLVGTPCADGLQSSGVVVPRQ